MASKIHSINYVIGILAAIAIGIDCAINGFIYMSMAGGIYIFPPLIIACCIATLLLNSILYFQDIPGAFQQLYEDLSIPRFKSIFTKKFWINAILYLISVSSALTMGAFTYFSYVSLPATILVMPQALIIIFCLAYVCGTFAILKSALDNIISDEKHEGQYDFMKVINKIREMYNTDSKKFYSFLALTAITLTGCIFTQITVLKGLQAALILLIPGLAHLAVPMFALFLLAEIVFTVNIMLYIVDKLDFEQFKTIAGPIAFIAIMLNAFCNAAITKASTHSLVYFTQSIGFVLSAAVMLRYIEDFITNFWNDDSAEKWHNVYNALFFVEHLVVMGTAAALISIAVIPLIAPTVGLFGAFCIGTVLLTLVFAADQAMDIYSSGRYATKEITVVDDNKPALKEDLQSNTTRVPLVVSAMPKIESLLETATKVSK